MTQWKRWVWMVGWMLGITPCFGGVQLASVFSDRAVLQQGIAVPVWGIGEAGATVTVTFADQTRSTRVSEDGTWRVVLDPLKVEETGRPLWVRSGGQQVEIGDVLVGEVWICSGQSNMQYRLNQLTQSKEPEFEAVAALNREEIEGFADPLLRINTAVTVLSPFEPVMRHGPSRFLSGWKTCEPPHTGNASAVAFYFGKKLREELKVPVGLILCAWGGQVVEPFIPPNVWREDPSLTPFFESQQTAFEEYRAYLADKERIDRVLADHQQRAREAATNGAPRPTPPDVPQNTGPRLPGAIYNGMIAHLVPYAIRGAIWYQGESNVRYETARYQTHFAGLIRGWRANWGQGDFPFLFCQLAGYGGWERQEDGPVETNPWSEIQDQQLRVHRMLPHTGIAVLQDVGQAGDIHPVNKVDAGNRLALWALGETYGRKVPAVSGPLYRRHRIEGNRVLIEFDHAGSGLTAGRKQGMQPVRLTDDPIGGFQICGEDREWKWAEVRVWHPDTLEVSHPDVSRPVEVRYGWKGIHNRFDFYNREGLPAAVFRTTLEP